MQFLAPNCWGRMTRIFLWQFVSAIYFLPWLFCMFMLIIKYVIIRVFPANVKHVKIRYNSLKISLSDVIVHLQGLLFSVQWSSLVVFVLVRYTRTKLYFLQLLI